MHTNAAHQAIRTMAMTHSSSSSSSSGESVSDCKSPFLNPICPTAPLSQSHISSQSSTSPLKSSDKLSVSKSYSPPATSSKTTATTAPPFLSPPPPLLPAAAAAANSPPQPQFAALPTLLPRSIPSQQQGLPLLASPSSSMLGRVHLPVQIPTGAVLSPQQSAQIPSSLLGQMMPPPSQTLLAAQHPAMVASNLSSMLITGPINQVELEILRDLQRKISERLRASQAAASLPHEEGLAEHGRLSVASRLMELKASSDSSALVPEFTHCIAGPAEKLEQVPLYQERMRHLLAQHEVNIQYIDRQPSLQPPPPLMVAANLVTSTSPSMAAAYSLPATRIPPQGSLESHPASQQVSLSRERLPFQNSRPPPTALTLSATPSSSSIPPTVPSIASAPSSTCIAATPTTSTIASCPFTLPTSVTPATPNPGLLTLSSPYAGVVAPLAINQAPVAATAAATPSLSIPGHAQSPLVPVLLPQQALSFLASQQTGSGNYCILPSSLQQPQQISVAGILSPPAAVTNSSAPLTSAATIANLPQQIQPSHTPLIPSLPTGGIVLNNMGLPSGGANAPMYVLMPAAYPTVLPTIPSQAAVVAQPAVPALPTANPATPIVQVARSASVMLDHQRPSQQHQPLNLAQMIVRSQEAAAGPTSQPQVPCEVAGTLGKRPRPLNLPDSTGEKILKFENPAAAAPAPSSSSPFKIGGVGADRNHPRWPPGNLPGSSRIEVGKATSQGQRAGSSDSDKSN